MTIKQIIGTGLTRALGTGLIADLAGDAVAGAAKALKDHLSLDGQDLALAFQDSLSRGAAAIALGLSAEGAGVLTRLGQGTRRALAANLAQTYAARVERDFLLPYAATQGLSAQDLPVLRRQTLDLCQVLAQQRARILPPEDLDDGALGGDWCHSVDELRSAGRRRSQVGSMYIAQWNPGPSKPVNPSVAALQSASTRSLRKP